jgi:hypothetical protein
MTLVARLLAVFTQIADDIQARPLPMYVENTADVVRNATTMVAVPGMSVTLEANAVYEVSVLMPFNSVIAGNTLRIGLAALPTGAKCALEVSVWNSASAGTAPRTNHFWTSSAQAVAGTPGSGSILGQMLLASITGRIRTGSAGGVLAVTAGSITALGNVTVAANAASLRATRIM